MLHFNQFQIQLISHEFTTPLFLFSQSLSYLLLLLLLSIFGTVCVYCRLHCPRGTVFTMVVISVHNIIVRYQVSSTYRTYLASITHGLFIT